ncbi:MAG: hypothetical protein Q8903_13200, partial [Bacteroidota bacterium]|nr:hypothetical protein [Bacteroidota bacterium]
FIIFVLFTVSFIQPNNKPKTKTGAIFGKVAFLETKNIKPFKIILMGTSKIVQPDSEGYFYINNLKPGIYDIKIQTEGLIDQYAEKITVLKNKITCLIPVYIDLAVTEKIQYVILNYQKRIEPIKYGKIEGYFVDTDGNPVSNAYLCYHGHLLGGKSDSSGYFRINKIIPGHYKYISGNKERGFSEDIEVNVKPDSVLNIKLKVYLNPYKYDLNN